MESDFALAGRLEQGVVKPAGEVISVGVVKPAGEVISLPSHTASDPYTGKLFTVEMHHQRLDQACPGDNVTLNIKGLDKNNMPRSADVMVHTVSSHQAGPSWPRAYGTTTAAATAVAKSAELAQPPGFTQNRIRTRSIF